MGGSRECEVLHTRLRTETESKKQGTPDVPTDRERLLSRKYGRTAADALPKPRYGMRCSDEPQLEQGDGDEQDSDTGDIAPTLN